MDLLYPDINQLARNEIACGALGCVAGLVLMYKWQSPQMRMTQGGVSYYSKSEQTVHGRKLIRNAVKTSDYKLVCESGCSYNSFIGLWRGIVGVEPVMCSNSDCLSTKAPFHGAHVFLLSKYTWAASSTIYIVPLCTKCNNTHNTQIMSTIPTTFVPVRMMCHALNVLPSTRFNDGKSPTSPVCYFLMGFFFLCYVAGLVALFLYSSMQGVMYR
eukprot:TRINITY_DN16147_c0_g1_i1.p1 TRINITY_DN16147_c0_g1~~TRINITY_DN16147_c0_g1_i1.p1  ORF type:complete len:214 (+),score=1.41 TRINITY_DN16147_c0_g1_i1:24-665(+)